MPNQHMHIPVDDPQDSGMTEIALALAMGFFSLMILTLISMGAGGTGDETQVVAKTDVSPETISIEPSRPSSASAEARAASEAVSEDLVIVYDAGRYFDASLKPIDPDTALAVVEPGRRVVLAVDPNLPLTEIMAARQGVSRSGLVVTGFGTDWRDRLEAERQPDNSGGTEQ